MKSRLDQIEHRLQSFIENSFFIFPWNNRQTLFSHLLVEAVQRTLMKDASGQFTPGNQYSITANPEMLHSWQADENFLPALSKVLFEAAQDAGIFFTSPPAFKLIPDPSIPTGKLKVEPFETRPTLEQTGVMTVSSEETRESNEKQAVNAFLILNGNQVYPLQMPVINLGRRTENQVIIDDPRVSRSHAQLRLTRGEYILCDLNSTGGTFVNGVQITQCHLRPGDVISLAGVSIIYGEESTSDQKYAGGDTSELHLGSGNHDGS